MSKVVTLTSESKATKRCPSVLFAMFFFPLCVVPWPQGGGGSALSPGTVVMAAGDLLTGRVSVWLAGLTGSMSTPPDPLLSPPLPIDSY